jgi:hypothetical protein
MRTRFRNHQRAIRFATEEFPKGRQKQACGRAAKGKFDQRCPAPPPGKLLSFSTGTTQVPPPLVGVCKPRDLHPRKFLYATLMQDTPAPLRQAIEFVAAQPIAV